MFPCSTSQVAYCLDEGLFTELEAHPDQVLAQEQPLLTQLYASIDMKPHVYYISFVSHCFHCHYCVLDVQDLAGREA